MTYKEFKSWRQQRFNEFSNKYMFYAFSKEQFVEGMKKFGLDVTDTDKINQVGYGGFVLREKAKAFFDMNVEHAAMLIEMMKDEDFAYDAFLTELANHEYCVTYDSSDALAALGFELEEVRDDEMLSKTYLRARNDYLAEVEI